MVPIAEPMVAQTAVLTEELIAVPTVGLIAEPMEEPTGEPQDRAAEF